MAARPRLSAFWIVFAEGAGLDRGGHAQSFGACELAEDRRCREVVDVVLFFPRKIFLLTKASPLRYTRTMAIKISDHVAQTHGLPKKGTLHGHRITVEGFYFAFDKASGDKIRRKYSEVFELAADEHRVHGQGALGRILSDKQLSERLARKDPDFRAVQTHVVSAHENITEDAPEEAEETEAAE